MFSVPIHTAVEMFCKPVGEQYTIQIKLKCMQNII